MPVVDVGVVGMTVGDRLVDVDVAVGLVRHDVGRVLVPVVQVVDVAVRVRGALVPMLVLVPLAHVEPGADRHHHTRGEKARAHCVVEEGD